MYSYAKRMATVLLFLSCLHININVMLEIIDCLFSLTM